MTETRYRREFADEVCSRLAEGASLREVCREHGVPESSFREWVRSDRDGLASRYQTARALQVEAWSDLIIEISNREDLEAQEKRVRIDSLKWLMSRIVPKKWGDRLLVAGDLEAPIQHLHRQVKLTDLSDEQIDALDGFTKSLLVDATPG
jgi:transposase-like protein